VISEAIRDEKRAMIGPWHFCGRTAQLMGRNAMLSVNGVYENGEIRLLEPLPSLKRARVIVTIVEEMEVAEDEGAADVHLFDDFVGVVDARLDGSEKFGQASEPDGLHELCDHDPGRHS
jgi:hypothetical protein